jgi:hypothetical protein
MRSGSSFQTREDALHLIAEVRGHGRRRDGPHRRCDAPQPRIALGGFPPSIVETVHTAEQRPRHAVAVPLEHRQRQVRSVAVRPEDDAVGAERTSKDLDSSALSEVL